MMAQDDDSCSAYSDYSYGSDYDDYLSDDDDTEKKPNDRRLIMTTTTSSDDLSLSNRHLPLGGRCMMTNDSSLGSNWVDSETTMNFSSRIFHNDECYIMTGDTMNISIDSSALGYEEASPDTACTTTNTTWTSNSAGVLVPPWKVTDLARADSGHTMDCTTDGEDSDDDDDDDSTFYSNSSVATDHEDDFQPSSYYDTRRRNSLLGGGRRSSLSGLARIVRRPSLVTTPTTQELGYGECETPNTSTEDLGYHGIAAGGGSQLRRTSTFGGRRSSITGLARVRRPSATPSAQEDLGYGCVGASTPNTTEDLGYGNAARAVPQVRRTSTFGGRRSSITGLARVRRPSVTPSAQDLGCGSCAIASTPNTKDRGCGNAAGGAPQLPVRRTSTFGGRRSSLTGLARVRRPSVTASVPQDLGYGCAASSSTPNTEDLGYHGKALRRSSTFGGTRSRSITGIMTGGGGARRQSMPMSMSARRRPSMLGKPSLEPIEDQSESQHPSEQSMQDLGFFEEEEDQGCAATRMAKVKGVKGVIDKVRKKIKAGLRNLDDVLQQGPTNQGEVGYGNTIPDNDALDYGYGYAVPDSDDLGYSSRHSHHNDDEFAPAIYYETRRRNSLRGDVRDGLARVRRQSLSASHHTQVSALTDNSASYQNNHDGGEKQQSSSRWEQIERRPSDSLPLCPQRRRQSIEDCSPPPELSTYTDKNGETDFTLPNNRWESEECVCEKKLLMSSRRSSVTLPIRPSRRTSCGSVAA